MTNTAIVGALRVPSEGTRRILPDSEGVFDAVARIGYEFEHAVADLVDNSIDAHARNVLIRFIYDNKAVQSVAVIDDGQGMNDQVIDQAMAFGARTGKGHDSLGKYGMGLKAATFSQCGVLTVMSRSGGRATGRRWTAEKAKADWSCEVLNASAASQYMKQHETHRVVTSRSGTIVEWGDLDVFAHSMIAPAKTIERRFKQLANHLGLVFHRFLQHEIEFMKGSVGDPEIDSWQVLLPQLVGPSDGGWQFGKHSLSIHRRSYWNGDAPLVNAYAVPDDRAVAEIITGKRPNDGTGIDHMIAPRRGVLLVYPIKHELTVAKDFVPTMGLSFLFSRNHLARQIGFAVLRPGEPDEPVVDV